MTVGHGLGDQRAQGGIRIEVREALAQVDGLVLDGQAAHDGEDGGADVGKFGSDHGGREKERGMCSRVFVSIPLTHNSVFS